MEHFFQENPNLFYIILLTILAWTLPWKGIALWKAAGKRQKGWFIAILLLNTFAILDILYIFLFSRLSEKKKVKNQEPHHNRQKHSLHDMQKPKLVI